MDCEGQPWPSKCSVVRFSCASSPRFNQMIKLEIRHGRWRRDNSPGPKAFGIGAIGQPQRSPRRATKRMSYNLFGCRGGLRGKCFRPRQIHRQFTPPQHIRMCGRKNFPSRREPYSSVDVAGCSGETGIGGVIGVMIRGCWKALCPQGAEIQSRRKGAAAITASTISVAANGAAAIAA
jgi:hypothetical protein